MDIIVFKEEKAGNVKYTAACIEDYEKILCRKISVNQVKREWFDSRIIVPATAVELTLKDGFTVMPNQLICNLENLLVIDKRSIEFKKVCLAERSTDPNIMDFALEFKQRYPGATIYTDHIPQEVSNSQTKTKAFVRIPRPELKDVFVLPLSELYRLSDKPAMTLEDYTKIKGLMQSSNDETKQLGLIATTRWNPVLSFEYLIMLAHINIEVLSKEPLHSYLKTVSSSVTATGFSGDLHLDAIDSLCVLNSMVRDGDECFYRNDVNGMMSFVLNEYSPEVIEKSEKFTFKAKLKSKK
jgi:hypothetical protein